jgi:ribosome-associated protein
MHPGSGSGEGERLEAADVARLVVDLASEKQASDIIMLDLRQVSLLADYFVICSASSERQMTAIADEILGKLRNDLHLRPLRREGNPPSGWLLLDYGDVVVHIFAPAERDYYRLEDLWAHALPVVRVQ